MPSDLAFQGDAAAISASIFILGGLGAFLARRRLRAAWPAGPDALAMAAVLVVAAALRLYHVSGFGQTWDEDVYWSSGRNYLENLVHLDFRARMWRWNYEHPPVAKYLVGLGALWHDGYGPARALVALVGAATCVVVYLLGRDLFSRRVGVCAALLYALLPPAIAHSQISGLETPSTFFATLSLWAFLRRRHLGAGVAGGLAAASRFIAGLSFVALFLGSLLRRPRDRAEWVRLGLSPLVGVATLVAVWPRLWIEGPVAGLRASLQRLAVQHTPEWFFGATILHPMPKLYFPAYFAAGVTPALLVGLLGLGWRRERAVAIGAAFFAAPFLLCFSPVIQSGLRYLLPALPPAAVLSAAGLEAASARLGARLRRDLFPATCLVAALASLWSCLQVRPYYLDYYNFLFGGPRAALDRRRFVFGWWGEGIAPAVAWFNAHAAPGTTVYYNLFPNHVVWLRDDVRPVRAPAEATMALVNHFQFERPPAGFREVFREEVTEGAPLSAVYVRQGAAPAPKGVTSAGAGR
jgi:4-amino-4-deoxy-L-arabinose transferase-like glycosyltransferase